MDNRERLLVHLDALRKAVKNSTLSDAELGRIYFKLCEVDGLFEPGAKTSSIMELQGLGKEVWQDIDVDEYVNQLRDEWSRP
jgi:hypothetical protein